MLALNNAAAPDLRLPDLHCTPMEPDNPTAKFDVVLNLSDHGEVLGVCEYDVDVYDAAVIDLLLRQLGGCWRRSPPTPTANCPMWTC